MVTEGRYCLSIINISFSVAKVRDFVVCCDCGKRRVVYSSKKLSPPEERALCRLQEELLYTCGSPLFPGGEFQDTIVVREGLNCQTPIETTYYAGKKKYIL